MFGHMSRGICFLGSSENGRWMLLSGCNLGRRCVHTLLGSLLSLSNGFICVHSFFFNNFLPNCVQLVVPPSVDSKLLMKFRKYGIIHLGCLLELANICQSHFGDVLLTEAFLLWYKQLVQVDLILHIYKCLIHELPHYSMDFKYLNEDDTMVDVFPNALVLHHFSCKAIIENLGLVKEGALHQVILNKLIGIGQEVL